VNRSLPKALQRKNIKPQFLVTGIYSLNIDEFTDKDFSPPAVTDRPLQDNKHLDNSGLSDCQTSKSNLDSSSQRARSDLNTGCSFSEKRCTVKSC
jgi:hypothetical protein